MHTEQTRIVQRLRSGGEVLWLIAAAGHGAVDASEGAAVVWLVLRGQVRVIAREGNFMLGARDWIALGGDSAPSAVVGPDALLLGVCLRSDDRSALLPGRGRLAPGQRSHAMRIWRKHGVRSAWQRQPLEAGDAVEVLAFLANQQAELAAGAARCPGHSQGRKHQVLLRMQRARLCLEGQVGDGLLISDLARRINFSPWYFSKVFHAVYGMRPQQYAAGMRLERASRLLATTSLPVIEVSAACGFDNPCSFARAFRARFGMTASQHRLRGAR